VEKVNSELKSGAPIAEIARDFSDEPKSSRGNYSWRGEAEMPHEVWEAAGRAPLGKSVGPIPSDFGTFFFLVDERQKASRIAGEERRDAARSRVASMKKREAVENYLASLRSAAKIRVDFRALARL